MGKIALSYLRHILLKVCKADQRIAAQIISVPRTDPIENSSLNIFLIKSVSYTSVWLGVWGGYFSSEGTLNFFHGSFSLIYLGFHKAACFIAVLVSTALESLNFKQKK